MNRLDTIVTRERKLRTRDLFFACFIALVAAVSITSVSASFDSGTKSAVAAKP